MKKAEKVCSALKSECVILQRFAVKILCNENENNENDMCIEINTRKKIYEKHSLFYRIYKVVKF